MNSYTIYCTEAQTKKALGLGAPIIEMPFKYKMPPDICAKYRFINFNSTYYVMPTVEQMIGWLEEHEEIDEIAPFKTGKNWDYVIYMTGSRSDIENLNGTFSTRREATLAAIDAALDYLSNKKIKFK